MKAKTILLEGARAAVAFLMATGMAVGFTACSDKNDDGGADPTPTTETLTRTVAIVAPTGDATLKTRLERTADWFQEKFTSAQQSTNTQHSSTITLNIEWYDELSEDLTSLSKTLAGRTDLVAVIGPFGNEAVNTFAPALKKKQKALIAPTCTSEDVQRSYAISSSTDPNAGNPFFWPLTQCDTYFSEQMMEIYSAYVTGMGQPDDGNIGLFSPDDKYGKTFTDWVPYYAENYDVELSESFEYTDGDELVNNVTGYLDAMKDDDDAISPNAMLEATFCVVEDAQDIVDVARARRQWIVENYLHKNHGDANWEDAVYDEDYETIEGYFRSWFCYNALSQETIDNLSTRNKAIVQGYQGFSVYANPETGFADAYKEKYGTDPLFAEIKLYDALLLTGMATILYEEKNADSSDNSDNIDNASFNKCIWEIAAEYDNSNYESDPIWDTGNMRSYISSLRSKKAAPHSFHGASTYIAFDSETTTQLVRPTFLHWQIKDSELKHVAYFAPNKTTIISKNASWIQDYDESSANDDFAEMAEDSDPGIEYPALTDQYAVLVHGSTGFTNYRHQADVLNVYQLLRQNGFDDDHIILIIDKALANDSQNEEPGVIRISKDGKDLLGGTDGLPKAVVDYDAADLTPEDISNILEGNSSDRLTTVLPRDAGQNVLLYWSGHGSKGSFNWRDADEGFTSDRLYMTATDMTFRKLFIVAEPCYGESVINGIKGIEGVLAMSGASSTEQSWADNWNSSMLIWMCDRFTKNVVNYITSNPTDNYNKLYNYTVENTLGSHTKIVNASYFGNLYKETPEEFFVKH